MNNENPNNLGAPMTDTPVTPTPAGEAFVASSVPTEPVQPVATTGGPAPSANPKKGGIGKILIIVGVVLVVLGVAGYFIFTKVLVTPQKVYSTTVEKTMKNLSKSMNDSKLAGFILDTTKPFELSGDVEFTSSEEIPFNGFKLTYGLGVDYASNKLALNLDLNDTKKKDDIITIGAYLAEKHGYLEAPQLIDKLLDLGDLDIDLSTLQSSVSEDDMNRLFNTITEGTQNFIKDAEITSSSTTIKVNGKDVKVTDNVLTINDANAKALVKSVAESIKKDTASVKAIASLLGYTENEINQSLDSAIKGEGLTDSGINFKIHLYTNGLLGDNLVGADLYSDSEKAIEIRDDGNKTYVQVGPKDSAINMVVEENKLEIKASDDSINLTINTTDTNIKITGTFVGLNVNADVTIDTNNANELKYGMSFTISEDDVNITVKCNANFKNNVTVKIPDVSKAVSVDALTDAEMEQVVTNLQTVLEKTGILDIVSAISDSTVVIDDNPGFDDDPEFVFEYNMLTIKLAADRAYNDLHLDDKKVCVSLDYLKTKSYVTDDEVDGLTGSVLLDFTDELEEKYYFWLSDGTNVVENLEYWDTLKYTAGSSTSNSCGGASAVYCGPTGTCK